MGYTIPCSGHTAKEVDFMYSTKFTFLNLNLFKGAQPIISVPNVTTFLPCNIETLLIFFLTPLTIFIVLCSNREQTCYILVISYSPQQSTINSILFPYLSIYANLSANLEFNFKKTATRKWKEQNFPEIMFQRLFLYNLSRGMCNHRGIY